MMIKNSGWGSHADSNPGFTTKKLCDNQQVSLSLYL